MKRILRLLFVPMVIVAFAGASFAQTTPQTPAKPIHGESKRDSGQLVAVDTKAGTLKVKTKDKELSLIAESKEAKAALAKVKVGEKVRFGYVEKGGKLILINVGSPKGSTSGKTTQTKPSEQKEGAKPGK